MYNILIVEDEEYERLSLVKILQKEFSVFEKICTAKNSVEALFECNKNFFNIIFMDINIPGKNGLTLIAELKQVHPETQFIIISSYNYFEYAQTAISLGVKDYILKPYKIDKLVEQLKALLDNLKIQTIKRNNSHKLQLEIDRIKPMLDTECIYAIITKNNTSSSSSLFKYTNYDVQSGFCFILKNDETNFVTLSDNLEKIKCAGHYYIKCSINKYLIIFILSNTTLSIQSYNELINISTLNQNKSIYGIGTLQYKPALLRLSYVDAINHLDTKKTENSNILSTTLHSSDSEVASKCVFSIINAFDEHDESIIFHHVHSYVATIFIYSVDQIIPRIDLFIDLLITKLEKKFAISIDKSTLYQFGISDVHSFHNLEINIYYNIKIILNSIKEVQDINTNLLVKKALSYIKMNYKKNINLNDLADYLKVSPSYISHLLNQNSSKKFTDLINEYRIEEAKTKLMQSKSIKEVAFEVGYQSQSYFSRIFKEYTGISPKIYKNSTKI